MRTFFIILFLLIIVVAGGYWYVTQNIDGIVEAAIENSGSEATQSNVSVDSVSISFENGSGSLSGLSVANPAGFSQEKVVTLDGIDLAIDPQKSDCSITGCKLVHIKELTVRRPVISYEFGVTKSNIQAIKDNVERYSGGGGGSSSSDGTKFVIDKLTVTPGEIKVRTKVGKLASSDLPEILKENLGAGTGGISGAELAEILVSDLSSNASFVVNKGALSGLVDNPLTEGIGSVGGEVKRGIGGLFGGGD